MRLGPLCPSHLEPASQRVVSRVARCKGVLGRSQRTWKINILVWVPRHASLPQDGLVSSVVRRKTVCRTLPSSFLRFPKKAKGSPKRGVWPWLVTRTPKFPLCLRGGPISGKGALGPTYACSSPRVAGLAGVVPCLRGLSGLDVVQDWLSSLTSFLSGAEWSSVELRLWEKRKEPRAGSPFPERQRHFELLALPTSFSPAVRQP